MTDAVIESATRTVLGLPTDQFVTIVVALIAVGGTILGTLLGGVRRTSIEKSLEWQRFLLEQKKSLYIEIGEWLSEVVDGFSLRPYDGTVPPDVERRYVGFRTRAALLSSDSIRVALEELLRALGQKETTLKSLREIEDRIYQAMRRDAHLET